jgi:hypothetical protein
MAIADGDGHDGEGVIIDAIGPRNVSSRGTMRGPSRNRAGQVVIGIVRQGGLGLPSYNPKPNLSEVKELTGDDERIVSALRKR